MEELYKVIGELYVDVRKAKEYIEEAVKVIQQKEEIIISLNAKIEELNGLLRVNIDEQAISEG